MKTNKRTGRIDLRIDPKAKEAIQAAVVLRHKTVSEFIIENAVNAAAEALADRRHFELSTEQWESFQAALDAPSRPMPRLERLIREPSIFDDTASEN